MKLAISATRTQQPQNIPPIPEDKLRLVLQLVKRYGTPLIDSDSVGFKCYKKTTIGQTNLAKRSDVLAVTEGIYLIAVTYFSEHILLQQQTITQQQQHHT